MSPATDDGASQPGSIPFAGDSSFAENTRPPNPADRGRLDSLQVCRGIAALMVLAFHAAHALRLRPDAAGGYHGGWLRGFESGVDFFFVLSGFIIAYIHLKDIGRPARLKLYLVKRLARILPLYWIALSGVVLSYIAFPSLGPPGDTEPGRILRSYILVTSTDLPVLSVAWTLRHELVFYVAFGLGFALRPLAARWIFLLWMAASLLVYIHYAGDGRAIERMKESLPLVSFLLSPFNLQFGLGVLAAWITLRRPLRRWARAAIGAGLVLAAAAITFRWALDFGDMPNHVYRVFAYGIPAFLVVLGLASLERQAPLQPIRQLSFLGDASYSIYLVHTPVIGLILAALHPQGSQLLAGIAMAAASVGIGAILYLLAERPLLRASRKWARAYGERLGHAGAGASQGRSAQDLPGAGRSQFP